MISSYKVGESVKISRNGERFWNEVMSVISPNLLLCRVDNPVRLQPDLKLDSIIVIDTDTIVDYCD
tara:strand:+ start:2762 stop:2959 length:198 start_codon:yes stop_codon:yes gene_type:complete